MKYTQEEILLVAEKVKILFAFMAELIPQKELIKETFEFASDRASKAAAMAVLIPDSYEIKQAENLNVARRGECFYQLLCALEEGEQNVLNARKRQGEIKKNRDLLSNLL